MKDAIALLLFALLPGAAAREIHVSVKGSDTHDGSSAKPFQTISAAAAVARPGDVITVHAGVYRERVTPPRGGESDAKRIVYQAAPGEEVVIKGSEVIRSWERFQGAVWKATVPNSFFGGYNPYKDLIAGDWFTDRGRPHHTGEVYLNGQSLFETHLLERVLNPRPFPDARDRDASTHTWFAETDDQYTYIYANFRDKDPNKELVEINVRDSCFYPDRPGRDYITVRGFRMAHAATQWAAPTAEQIGLIGTHWSKGWIIEDNVISDSKCVGISLGKDRRTGHNVWINDPRKDGATHYNEVILRALAAGWSRERIGSHIVRNNVVFKCEQAGIVGSLGAAFSTVTGNVIHDIHVRGLFTGAEMAGIKFHAAIDATIRSNHIYRTCRGLWLDWMAQGTRVSRNLFHDNAAEDLFMEVNHGPFLVDNNLFLSPTSLLDMSQGGAYAHNLFAGRIISRPELSRETPFHPAHSTKVAGLVSIQGGDNRFYNNLFIGPGEAGVGQTSVKAKQAAAGHGLWVYDAREFPSHAGGNVYCNGARPYFRETNACVVKAELPRPQLLEAGNQWQLELTFDPAVQRAETVQVSTALLGKARIPGLPYVQPDGAPLVVDQDYFGQPRDAAKPTPGPFEGDATSLVKRKVW